MMLRMKKPATRNETAGDEESRFVVLNGMYFQDIPVEYINSTPGTRNSI